VILLNDRRTRRRRLGAGVIAGGLLAALLVAAPAGATPDPGDVPPTPKEVSESARAEAREAIANGEIPGQDEIVHSADIEHVANIGLGTGELAYSTVASSQRNPARR
jgi:hypothetical protein